MEDIMKNRRLAGTGLVIGMAFVVGTAAYALAADTGKPPSELDAVMMQVQKYGTPGESHKRLEPFVGKWTFRMRYWMKPGDTPQELHGMSENAWVFGGRFLKRDFKSALDNQPVDAVGYTGYDNIRGEYQTVWLGTMGTGIMQVAGTYVAAANAITESGHFSCPITGEKARWMRSEWKILDNDHHTFSSYAKGPDGKEYKSVEEVYTRVN
jgi:hypothetical protein